MRSVPATKSLRFMTKTPNPTATETHGDSAPHNSESARATSESSSQAAHQSVDHSAALATPDTTSNSASATAEDTKATAAQEQPRVYTEADYAPTFENIVGDVSNLFNYNRCRKYFINLDSRKDRYEQTRTQVGDTFIRVSACNGRAMDYPQVELLFDEEQCHKIYKVWQSNKQAAATISHFNIYSAVAQDELIGLNDWVLIAEDDNHYITDFAPKLDQMIEYLKDSRFNHVKMVILKQMEIHETVDYVWDICEFSKKHRRTHVRDCAPQIQAAGNYNAERFAVSSKYDIYPFFRTTKDRVFEFRYEGVKPSPEPNLYDDRQHLFYPTYVRPYSASLYLIRRSACIDICRRYKRPFWYADDFKQIVPPQCILYASPFMAYEVETAQVSSITDELAKHNWHFNKINRPYNRYQFITLQKLRFLTKWMYGSDKRKQRAAILMQRLLGLYY